MHNTTHQITVKSQLAGYELTLTIPPLPRAMLHRFRAVFSSLAEPYGFYGISITDNYHLAYNLFSGACTDHQLTPVDVDDLKAQFRASVIISAHQHNQQVKELTIDEAIDFCLVTPERVYGRIVYELVAYAAWRM